MMRNGILLLVLSPIVRTVLTSAPCSSSPQTSSVIDICSSRKVKESSSYNNILIRVTTTEECQCTLSITEHVEPVQVIFRKYDADTSVPPGNNCGVNLYLESINGIFKKYYCDIFDTIYTMTTGNDVKIFTRSTSTGSLNENEGYCLDIFIDPSKNYNSNRTLILSCNNTLAVFTTDETKTISTGNTTKTDGNNIIRNALIGAACGGIVFVFVIALVFIFRKKIKRNDDVVNAHRSKRENNVQDSSENELQYNVLYQPATSVDIKNLQPQKREENDGIDGHYSDIDVFQKGRIVSGEQHDSPEKTMTYDSREIDKNAFNPNVQTHQQNDYVYSTSVTRDNCQSIEETPQTTSDSDMKNSYLYAVVNKIKKSPVSESNTS